MGGGTFHQVAVSSTKAGRGQSITMRIKKAILMRKGTKKCISCAAIQRQFARTSKAGRTNGAVHVRSTKKTVGAVTTLNTIRIAKAKMRSSLAAVVVVAVSRRSMPG